MGLSILPASIYGLTIEDTVMHICIHCIHTYIHMYIHTLIYSNMAARGLTSMHHNSQGRTVPDGECGYQ